MTSAEMLERTSRQFFTAMNDGDMDALLATLAPDAVSYEPVGTPGHHGHAALRAFYGQMGQMFGSLRLDVDSLFVVDGATAIRWTGRGTLPDGDVLTFEGIDVHEFDDDGRIRSVKGYFDPTPMMAAAAAATP